MVPNGSHVCLVGGWQSDSDVPHRKKILVEIIACLQEHKPLAQPDWVEQVPQMARQLEDMLYRSASTFDLYSDLTTLGQRLQQTILGLGREVEQAEQQHQQEGEGQSDPQIVSETPDVNTPEHREQVVWQQQERLLLLRHASKCTAPNDRCTATPLCAKMKILWNHISVCTAASECKTKYCISSRYVLSHWHHCQDSKCDVCAPVNEVIRKSRIQKQPQATATTQDSGILSEISVKNIAAIGPADMEVQEKQRNIDLHMQLLDHTVTCVLPTCPSDNCRRMKELLAHDRDCEAKVNDGCQLCRRVWALLQIHARQCTRDACPVPKCGTLRESMRRQLAMQQA